MSLFRYLFPRSKAPTLEPKRSDSEREERLSPPLRETADDYRDALLTETGPMALASRINNLLVVDAYDDQIESTLEQLLADRRVCIGQHPYHFVEARVLAAAALSRVRARRGRPDQVAIDAPEALQFDGLLSAAAAAGFSKSEAHENPEEVYAKLCARGEIQITSYSFPRTTE